MGFAERVALLENDAEHNYNTLQREGVARWMSRWLLGKDAPIVEPPITLLSAKEYQCTPDGEVMRSAGRPIGVRSQRRLRERVGEKARSGLERRRSRRA